MLRAFSSLLLAAVLLLGAPACQKKMTAAQLNAEKEKVWREQQRERAIKFYQELVEKYPDSPFAAEAKQKLAALGPSNIPKPSGAAKPAVPAAKPGTPATTAKK